MNVLSQKYWSPYVVGAAIGILSWFAFASADHPIGITTPFEHTAALIFQTADPALTQTLYAENREAAGHRVGMDAGAWCLYRCSLSAWLSGDRTREIVPELWQWRFGYSVPLRLVGAILGAALMMIGARIAQGCTSGHGISGTLQLALSSWVFVVVIFSVSALTAFVMFGKRGREHV